MKKKLEIFILEDSIKRINRFKILFNFEYFKLTIATNYEESLKFFDKEKDYYLILIDFDIPSNDKTGLNFVKDNIDYLKNHPRVIIHSTNFKGALDILDMLPNATYLPFIGDVFLKD